ncbi:MAG: NACHT domain-containing protein, partial [Gammaproteobacteria bacterium]|nr:NACHT domain-containing protein [Gammaproteobacteria bacterium]
MNMTLSSLIQRDECEYLEFKSEWYWHKGAVPTVRQWGEFLKDFVALINCNDKYIDQTKYLLIGVNESNTILDDRLIDTDLSDDNFPTLKELKTRIIAKISLYFKSNEDNINTYENFDLKYETIEGKKILVFAIHPASDILVLDKDIQDKNRTEKRNNVFVRTIKATGDPEVENASPEDIVQLQRIIGSYNVKRSKEINIEKSVEKTIKLFVDNNNIYTISGVHKEKIWKDNVLFEVYILSSDFTNINFIYLFDKSNQTKTYEYLIHNNIITDGSSSIVLIDNGLKKDVKGIKSKFKAQNVYSLDSFALEYLYKSHLNEDTYHDGNFKRQRQIKNFIDPFSDNSHEKDALTILTEWFNMTSMPLMVVKGYGGVGKTTLVKYFLDILYASYKDQKIESKILFIDSRKIIDEISREGNIDNVFLFYQAYARSKNLAHKFDKELLELSIDNGNILLVLDGIDEVIAKLGTKFKVETFISSIYENYLLGNERAKIIITCRDYFWDASNIGTHEITSLEIFPFNEKLAKQFFMKEFNDHSKELNQCLTYSEEFKLTKAEDSPGSKNVYIPYILDVIMDMVRQKKGLGEVSKNDVSSGILNTDIVNDYFIGRICNREVEKLKNLDID